MKKTIKFFAAVLALAIAAACSKVDSSDITNDVRPEFNYETIDITVTASLNGPTDPSETKATLASDGLSVYWTAGDQINMFPFKGTGKNDPSPYEGRNNILKVDQETISGGTAQFSGTAINASTYRAIYPSGSLSTGSCYGNDYVFSSNTLKNQTASESNFPTTSWGCSNISMAYDTPAGDMLHFKNMLSYFKFSVSKSNIYNIQLSVDKASYGADRSLSTSGNLGGTLHYRPATEKFDVFSDELITLSNNGQPFVIGKTYYVAIPPVVMQNLILVGKDNAGTIVFQYEKSEFTAESNTIYNLGELKPTSSDLLEVDLSNSTISPLGGEVTLTLSCNTDWEIAAGYDWLTISQTTGGETTNKSIKISASAFVGNGSRTAYIDIKTKTATKSVKIIQNAVTTYKRGEQVTKAADLKHNEVYIIGLNGTAGSWWYAGTGTLTLKDNTNFSNFDKEYVFRYHEDSSKQSSNNFGYNSRSTGTWVRISTGGYLSASFALNSNATYGQYITHSNYHGNENGSDIDMCKPGYSDCVNYNNSKFSFGSTSLGNRKWLIYKAVPVQ